MKTATTRALVSVLLLAVQVMAGVACIRYENHPWLVVSNDSGSGISEIVLSVGDMDLPVEQLPPGNSIIVQLDNHFKPGTPKELTVGVRFVNSDGESHQGSMGVPVVPRAVGEIRASVGKRNEVSWENALKSP